jgi:hypothetical protein
MSFIADNTALTLNMLNALAQLFVRSSKKGSKKGPWQYLRSFDNSVHELLTGFSTSL